MSNTRNHFILQPLKDAGYTVLVPFDGRRPTERELLELLPRCIGYIAGGETISTWILHHCKKLKVISRNGIGIDNIDINATRLQNIVVRVARGSNAQGVAELTIAFMFAMVRSIIQTHMSVKNAQWKRIPGIEISGKTLGIIGTGEIGQRVIKMAVGLNMNVVGYDVSPNPIIETLMPQFCYRDFDSVFQESDIISLHCPARERPIIHKGTISTMKKGVYLINTARSRLVNHDDLLNALEQEHVLGYAVDAFEQEPPEITPLLSHPRVILASHIGGFTHESIYRAARDSVNNLLEELHKR